MVAYKTIGLVKERKNGENRVAIIPEHAKILAEKGFTVNVETTAGVGAGYSDADYALHPNIHIIDDTAHVYKLSEMIVKVKEPIDFDLQYLTSTNALFCYLHLAPNPSLTQTLIDRKVDSYAFESIVDGHGMYPMLRPMSTIAGELAVHFASRFLQKNDGNSLGKLFGPTTKVVIAGCGTSGAAAGKLAVKMGAECHVADLNAMSLLHVPYATGAYCLKDATEKKRFYEQVSDCDVFIGAVLIPNKKAPIVLTKQQVKRMKPGALIVDIAIDQGGCVETSEVTSHTDPIKWKYGKGHICIPNMPGCVPKTASLAISLQVTENLLSGNFKSGANVISGQLVVDI